MPSTSHYGEQLQDFLEDRLGEPERTRLADHLAGCAQCHRELEALRWVKDQALGGLPSEAVPPGLAARVRAGLDAADAEARRGGPARLGFRPARWAAVAVLAAAVLVLFLVLRPASQSLPERAARDFAGLAAGRISLGVSASEPRVIEEYFARNGIGFATRVFDLGMMRYELLGGRVHRLGGRVSALFTYRGADGRLLVCQMYQGRVVELPPPDEVRENNGIAFQIYREENVTVVFWQEGDVVCVLMSDASSETVIQLAFAKAVKL
jgi:anti-sigma factor RsiW